MELRQIQASYEAGEDRILLRASFGADDHALQEIRAWLTRRLVKTLWPGIMQALETQITLDYPLASHARAEIVNMKHQATIDDIRARGKFDLPFAATAHSLPFGELPIVLTSAHISLQPKQTPRIQFNSSRMGSFELSLEPNMLHGFCTLLQEAVRLAEWDIELQLPGMQLEQLSEPRILN
jgi:hypothetical protein